MAVAQDAGVAYPMTRRVHHVDALHGKQIEDPYRWLEADIRTSITPAAVATLTR
jgi:prolyl oligopeptidase